MKINKKETLLKLDKIMSYEAVSVAEMVIERVEDFEDENSELFDKICWAVDDELIYTEDQWDIIKNYIGPSSIGSISFNDIINEFIEDIFNNCEVDYE